MDGQGQKYSSAYPHPNPQQEYPQQYPPQTQFPQPYPPAQQYPPSQYPPSSQYPQLYPPQPQPPPSYDVHQHYPAYDQQQQNVDFPMIQPQPGQVIVEQPGLFKFYYALCSLKMTHTYLLYEKYFK